MDAFKYSISAFLLLLYTYTVDTSKDNSSGSKEYCESDGGCESVSISPSNQCDDPPPNLGPIKVDTRPQSMNHVNVKVSNVSPGGHWQPSKCSPKQKVAIIIPYRSRPLDLPVLLYNLHPFLQKQQAYYNIFFISQSNYDKHFNRGILLNIGFKEALKEADFDCIILHDIDKWPEDTRNMYRCKEGEPLHLIGRYRHVGKDYRDRPYETYFGGVTAISVSDFKKINGYSNVFWGWGSEDDDLYNRLKHNGLKPSRADDIIGSYVESYQPYGFVNPRRHELVAEGKQKYSSEGLNNLLYEVLSSNKHQLYTNITVNILHEDPYPVK